MWLNLYGREAVRHRLKIGLKTQKMHFLYVFELMSDNIMAIQVEPRQCPLHQSILLIQGLMHEIFGKKILRIGGFEKPNFSIGHFHFFSKTIFLLHCVLKWMGLNIYDYDGVQPKMTFTKH